MLNFILFCALLLLAAFPASLVFGLVMMGTAVPLMALGERPSRMLRVPIAALLFIIQAYFWGAWAAFSVGLTARFSGKPEVTESWLYWTVGFVLCVSLVGYFAVKEATARAPSEPPPSPAGVTLYGLVCAAGFLIFATWPGAMRGPYGWLVGLVGVEVTEVPGSRGSAPIWLLVLAGVFATAVLALVLMFQRGLGRPVLRVRLRSRGSAGLWEVVMPEDTLVLARVMVVLLWIAKLRWLLQSEPAYALQAFEALMDDLRQSFDDDGAIQSTLRLDRSKRALGVIGLGGTPPGTDLEITLAYAPRGRLNWMLTNNLPARATQGDLLWSMVSLVEAAGSELWPEMRRSLSEAVVELACELGSLPPDRSLAGLQRDFMVAHAVGAAAALR